MIEPSFNRAILVLPVSDMAEARAWYADVLGFQTVFLNSDPQEDPAGNYAILKRGEAEFHLILDEPPREHPWTTAGTGYLFLTVSAVESLCAMVKSRGVPIVRALRDETWGARTFQLRDPSGNLILLAEMASAS